MPLFELVIALLLGGAVLAAVARKIRAPYPALLALGGAGVALLPNAPTVTLDPDLVLTLFVAPVLLDAAFDSSPRDLKDNWRAVTSLALVAVGVTVVAVAVVARWLVPDLRWPAAIALGAIVAPPDAAAATAVLRQLRPPHRVLVILQGESLFNDASALLTYRLAVAAAATGATVGWSALPMVAAVCAGSAVLGAALSRVTLWVLPRIEDVATSVILQFLTTFAVWMIAEGLHLSGIITMVVYAILVARKAPDQMPARLRIPSYAVWEVTVFVLNVLAFIWIGLQLKPLLDRLSGAELVAYSVAAAVVTATVILVRVVWVMGYATIGRWIRYRWERRFRRAARYPSVRSAVLISWCGMRGIVTLAAALALPGGFPQRDLILFIAFSVVLGTLVVQGMTVPALMRLLSIEPDDAVTGEVHLARVETAKAALAALGGVDQDPVAQLLRRKYEARLRGSQARAQSSEPVADDEEVRMTEVQRRLQEAQRRTLSELRQRGVIGDDAFHRVEEELDWGDVHTEGMARQD